jgi:hypothetical protein
LIRQGALVTDTAYGAAPMLNWLVEEKRIAPHIPVFDKSRRDEGTGTYIACQKAGHRRLLQRYR